MRTHSYTGATIGYRRLDGAVVCSILHPPGQRIEPHAHDWPVLTLYRIGGYREVGDDGEVQFDGPSAVFHPAGAAHADLIGSSGLETLAISFDPDWIGDSAGAGPPTRSRWWIGGDGALAMRALARLCCSHANAEELRQGVARFFAKVRGKDQLPSAPNWGARVLATIEEAPSTGALAHELALHPAWLARAYRAWRGEGLFETLRRRRVERAVLLLRADAPLADAAASAGFCDQSHMNRAFRAVLDRTPKQVRDEAALLAAL